MSEAPAETAVHITVDGKPVEARPGELVIDAAERNGFLTATLPDDGAHTVEATFRRSWADRLGVLITLAVVVARFAPPVLRRRRRQAAGDGRAVEGAAVADGSGDDG